MSAIDIDALQRLIDRKPTEEDIEYGDVCADRADRADRADHTRSHSKDCPTALEPGEKCIRNRIDEAEQSKRRHMSPHLLRNCFNDPWYAEGKDRLPPEAQDGCIYNKVGFRAVVVPKHNKPTSRKLRGIHVTMGWDYDVMSYKLALSIGGTWICVMVWKVATGDWGVAMALGNLIAALITLAFAVAKHAEH